MAGPFNSQVHRMPTAAGAPFTEAYFSGNWNDNLPPRGTTYDGSSTEDGNYTWSCTSVQNAWPNDKSRSGPASQIGNINLNGIGTILLDSVNDLTLNAGIYVNWGASVTTENAGVIVKWSDWDNCVFAISENPVGPAPQDLDWEIRQRVGGVESLVASGTESTVKGWQDIYITISGQTVSLYKDTTLICSGDHNSSLDANAGVGFLVRSRTGSDRLPCVDYWSCTNGVTWP